MPKINAAGVPSYDGHTGTVTNAVGEQFEVNPSLDLDGNRPEGYTDEPVGEFEETPAPGVAGPIVPVEEDQDDEAEDTDTDEKDDDTDTDGQDEKKPGNQFPGFDTPKKSVPAKSATPKK